MEVGFRRAIRLVPQDVRADLFGVSRQNTQSVWHLVNGADGVTVSQVTRSDEPPHTCEDENEDGYSDKKIDPG